MAALQKLLDSHGKLVGSGLLVLVTIVVAAVIGRALRRLTLAPEQKRRNTRMARALLTAGLAGLLVALWAQELKSAALVLSAFAVAMVVGTKELVLCVLGWAVKLAGQSYRIGDRVSIGGNTGEVLDHGVLTTTLVTFSDDGGVGGTIVTLPNSMLLSQPVHNYTGALSFVVRWVTFHVAEGKPWKRTEALLLRAGETVWAEHGEGVRGEMRAFERSKDFAGRDIKPAVFVRRGEKGVELRLRIALPLVSAMQGEDRIVRAVLAELEAQGEAGVEAETEAETEAATEG